MTERNWDFYWHLYLNMVTTYAWFAQALEETKEQDGVYQCFITDLKYDIDNIVKLMKDENDIEATRIYYALSDTGTHMVLLRETDLVCVDDSIKAIRENFAYKDSFVEFVLYPLPGAIRQFFHKSPREEFMFSRK